MSDMKDAIPLFAGLAESTSKDLDRLLRWRRYAPQEQIIDRQSESREVFFVGSGKVRVVIYSLSGREVTLNDVTAGGFFGELSAIDGEPRSASVMAIQESLVGSMSHEDFMRLLLNNPELSVQVMRHLARILRMATDRIVDLSTLGANNRVHAEILRQARMARRDPMGRAMIEPIPIHSDLASRVSTTRETVARVLNDLARQNIVRRDRTALVVLDVAQLEQMVEEVRGA